MRQTWIDVYVEKENVVVISASFKDDVVAR